MAELKARLSEEDHAAIMAYAEAEDVTANSIVVALARWLRSGQEMTPDVERCRKAIMEEARAITAEHKDRHPRDE